MKLHVLLYRDADNPRQIPWLWPAQVREMDDEAAPDAPWLEMSLDEYNHYRAQHQNEFDAWQSTQETEPATLHITRITALWQQLSLDAQADFAPWRAPFLAALDEGEYPVARRMIERQMPKLSTADAEIAKRILAIIPTEQN